MNFGIIGAGLIGKKRAVALKKLGHSVVAVTDVNGERARQLADDSGAKAYPNADSLLRSDISAVIVATTAPQKNISVSSQKGSGS